MRGLWERNEFVVLPSDEDIHSANERKLTELIGAVAGKLHTGRSRNDQVATDMRLWLAEECEVISRLLAMFVATSVDRADAEKDVLMPGYTHLQPAQPIRWSHWLLCHSSAIMRDHERLQDGLKRVRQLPLGSGALAGHAFGIDRRALAESLGLPGDRVVTNSLDAVSDRDFICEFLFFASMCSVHLSRWAEDLIIYSSREFGFVKIADAYSTGSSLMPQKRNPDSLELLRGKTGRVVGSLVGLLTTIKGLPTSYNKDLQEDKEGMFDALDTIKATLQIAVGVLSTLEVNKDRMRAALVPEMLATDLAEYLVRKGVPFRETHHVAGAAVALAEKRGSSLFELTLEDLKGLHPKFEADVLQVWSYDRSVDTRDTFGGTGINSVNQQIALAKDWVAKNLKN